MRDDELDRFVRRSLPAPDVSWAREERLADTVLRILSTGQPRIRFDARRCIVRIVVLAVSAIGLASGVVMSLGEDLSLDALFDAAASLIAVF
jgi:hypothetical protein